MNLYKHQEELLKRNPHKWLLAWGTGSGKTRTAIELAKRNSDKTLVICPKSLTENWKEEIVKWDGEDTGKEWRVIHKESFKKNHKNLQKYTCLIIDEAHFFGNYKSQLSKALLAYIELYQPKFIYLLTATPYQSSMWNIYSLAMILGCVWSWIRFKRAYFNDVKMGRRTVPVQKAHLEEECAKLVNKLGSTVRLEDCFDVPEQIFQNEYFNLTVEQKRGIAELVDLLPIVRFTKEHQICGGSLKGDGYVETVYYKSEKFERLLELIEEHPYVAVICRYNAEIDYLYDQISKTMPVWKITGNVKNRHEVIEEINKADKGVVLVNSACSEGWEIPRIPMMIFYSYDFSLKNFIQMKGRILRANNIKKNVYISLIVKGTIDEAIYKKVVIEKQDFHLELYK